MSHGVQKTWKSQVPKSDENKKWEGILKKVNCISATTVVQRKVVVSHVAK